MGLRYWLAGLLLLAGVGSLVFLASENAQADYVLVRELQADLERYRGRQVHIAGSVVAGSVKYDPDEVVLEFRMTDREGGEIGVLSRDPMPDAFKEGASVLVTGRFDPGLGRIDADDLKAKCPSRYEEEAARGEKDEGGTSSTPESYPPDKR